MKTPKITIKNKALPEILEVDSSMNSEERIREEVEAAFVLAYQMMSKAYDLLDSLLQHDSKEVTIQKWQSNRLLVRFFGSDEVNIKQIKKVHKRLRRAHRRFTHRRIKIRVVSKTIYSSKYENAYGLNGGYILSPNRFMLLPNWFSKNSIEGKASTIIHELFHDWFGHRKVEINNRKHKVTGSYTASHLAQKNPLGARREPENYEQFCLFLWREKLVTIGSV